MTELDRIKELMRKSPEGREALLEVEELQSEGVPDNDIVEALKLIMKNAIDEIK